MQKKKHSHCSSYLYIALYVFICPYSNWSGRNAVHGVAVRLVLRSAVLKAKAFLPPFKRWSEMYAVIFTSFFQEYDYFFI